MAVHLEELTRGCQVCIREGKGSQPCEYEIPGQETWEVDADEYKGCPFKIVTRQSAMFLKAYNFYKLGYLPNPGGWLAQPAKLLDAFELIEKTLAQINSEKQRKSRLFSR